MNRALEPGPTASPVYRHSMVVPASDVDGLGHASNVAYVRWVQEAALAHSDAVGWTLDRYVEAGIAFLVRQHEIVYLRPAYGDDELDIHTWIEGWTAATSLRRTVIRRAADGAELARALTTWVLVTRATGRPRRVPADVCEAFAAEPKRRTDGA